MTGKQYVEASVIGIRSAVITLKRRATPLRFVLFPMVHVAEPDFYREGALAGECALIVAEGAPSRHLQHWRDSQLVTALGAIHVERQHEPVKIAVVFGAAHIPAVVDYLAAGDTVRAWRLSTTWAGWPRNCPR